MSIPLYNSRIKKVKFSIGTNETIKKLSCAEIISHDLFRNNTPYPGGVYDAHTGTTDYSYKCQTCHNNKKQCLGHPGHIQLNYPVWSPMVVKEGKKWLKLICFTCGKPIISNEALLLIPKSKRLEEAGKSARSNKTKKCVHCASVHPIIKKDKNEVLSMIAEVYDETKLVNRWNLLPHKALEVLSRVTNETVTLLGKPLNAHPRHFILNCIQVPPVSIRPDVKKIGGGRSANDDLTTMLQIIIKKNDVLPTTIPSTVDPKLEKSIYELNNAYYDFVKASGDNSMNSLAHRLKGKEGIIRKNMLGKRVHGMCRSTITGHPGIKIDEVGVPLIFATTIQYKEVVQEFNKKRLMEYAQNGRKKYPGATKIIKKSSGTEYDIESAKDIELEIGDILFRDMIDGDPVNFNRQPSLMLSNISMHRVKVILDPNIKALIMNVIACPLYHADFDGDQMNLIIAKTTATMNEISELSHLSNWFISHMNSAPAMGQADDSIIGTSELTRTGVVFDKFHALLLFQNTTVLPNIPDKITGREVISKLLELTPVNFTRVPEIYQPNLASYIDYDPLDVKVKIEHGNLLSGVLDKKSIGKGASGGLYHLIANEYSTKRALDVMFNMQQTAISYVTQVGFTIGIMDLLLDNQTKLELDRISADIILKAKLITEELLNGEIIPPIGKTIEQFYEDRMINTLSIYDDFTETIVRAIDKKHNNLFKLIMSGSKGKLPNMYSMVSSNGQKIINDERVQQKFGHKRTLAYFPRFDTSPESRGFMVNSFLGGLSPWEYVFGAMAARFELISRALLTSVTGEQNRKSIKNLESIIINNMRQSLKYKNIIQLVYGEDFLDPRRLEKVKFPTVLMSDSDFEKKYKHPDFNDFFEIMKSERNDYRLYFFKLEYMNVKDILSDERKVAVDIERIVRDTIYESNLNFDSKVLIPPTELKKSVKTILEFCELLPYILINEIQERNRSPIPDHINAATYLLKMLIKSHLYPATLVNIPEIVLKIILNKIKLRYTQALVEPGTAVGIIAAQSFSEPFTQYVIDAHHRAASGGTSKSGMTKAKEVLGARDISKLDSPSVLITLLPEYSSDKAKVQEIANEIEVMKLYQFVSSWQIFFEKYNEIIHPDYLHENAVLTEFNKYNPLLTLPTDLIKWCLRFTVNKTNLILKNMPLDLIISKLRSIYTDLYIVHSQENSETVLIRIYFKSSMFKTSISTEDIKKWKDTILDTIIRGIEGIVITTVIKLVRNKIEPDGSIKRDNDQWGITTEGTNLKALLTNKRIDRYKIHSDAVQEMASVFGIEAARQKIITGLRNLIDSCNYRHFSIYADEMTYTGNVTSIEFSGLRSREASNVLLRIGFLAPMGTMEEAIINSMEDTVSGVTAPFLLGTIPRHGTIYNSFIVNKKFIKETVKKPDDIIDTLFD